MSSGFQAVGPVALQRRGRRVEGMEQSEQSDPSELSTADGPVRVHRYIPSQHTFALPLDDDDADETASSARSLSEGAE